MPCVIRAFPASYAGLFFRLCGFALQSKLRCRSLQHMTGCGFGMKIRGRFLQKQGGSRVLVETADGVREAEAKGEASHGDWVEIDGGILKVATKNRSGERLE